MANGESRSYLTNQYQTCSSVYPLQGSTFSDGQAEQDFRIQQKNPQKKLRRQPKSRTHFTTEQKQILNKLFAENCYPNSAMYSHLSRVLSVPVYSLKHWFKNRRNRSKGSNTHSGTKSTGTNIIQGSETGQDLVASLNCCFYQAHPNQPYLATYHSQPPPYDNMLGYPAHFCSGQPVWNVGPYDVQTQPFF